MVKRELQLYEGNCPGAKTEDGVGISIDRPHLLFDVPLEETLQEFISILGEYYNPEHVFEQLQNPDESPDRNPLFTFAQAIEEVLGLPESSHTRCATIATGNSAVTDELASWKDLAALWLWQYLAAYNEELYDRAPESLATLEEVVTDLQSDELISEEQISQIVEYQLSHSDEGTGLASAI